MLTTLLGWISILSSWTCDREPCEGVLHLVSNTQTGMLGSHGVDSSFLRVLGSHAGPDVPADRHLGRPRKSLRRDQFFLYTLAGSVADAARILFLYFNHHNITASTHQHS